MVYIVSNIQQYIGILFVWKELTICVTTFQEGWHLPLTVPGNHKSVQQDPKAEAGSPSLSLEISGWGALWRGEKLQGSDNWRVSD